MRPSVSQGPIRRTEATRSAGEREFKARGFAKQGINSEATRGSRRPARACKETEGRTGGEGRAVGGTRGPTGLPAGLRGRRGVRATVIPSGAVTAAHPACPLLVPCSPAQCFLLTELGQSSTASMEPARVTLE
uniref:Uncharacterized protein n=1 Tax=Rousettus aegyptiacus TaxID=9407 RepID=A0A7J8DIA5_ROUAE|nr:hypothetical protein HJG63_008704 [Rousettus aegyptiacus]